MSQDQKITKDERGQEQPTDKKRAQQSSLEGPAAYAPNNQGGLGQAKKSPSSRTGDDRTPDKPIGQVADANRDPAEKKTGEC